MISIQQIKQALDKYPDDMDCELVLLDENKNEIKLSLKSIYNKIDFDSEESKINNKLIFVMEENINYESEI